MFIKGNNYMPFYITAPLPVTKLTVVALDTEKLNISWIPDTNSDQVNLILPLFFTCKLHDTQLLTTYNPDL